MIKIITLLGFWWVVPSYSKQITINLGSCPIDNPNNIVIFIDACYAPNADFITYLNKNECPASWVGHSRDVIETYKKSGGKKKAWLLGFFDSNRVDPFINAVSIAINCGIKTISFSGGLFNTYSKQERDLIKFFTRNGGKYYAAAGNSSENIDEKPFHPASYPEVIAIGALDCEDEENLKKCGIARYSNYGKKTVKRFEFGKSWDGVKSGTSFAVPRAVAKDEK